MRWAALFAAAAPCWASGGEDASAAAIGLRAGFDSNPTNVSGAKGASFIAQFAAWDFLRGSDKDGFGLSLSASNIFYDPRIVAPTMNNALSFKHAIGLGEGALARRTISASQEQTWSRRLATLLWRERLDYERGAIRLFATVDARIASLNERNIFALGGFLPRDESFLTLSAMPGIAWRSSYGEIGASLSVARIRYLRGADYLGFRRDNNRFQANLFGSAVFSGVAFEGSLSLLNAAFPDKDFDDLRRILYTAKATAPIGPASLTLSSARSAEDTTLPLTVINIATTHEARLAAKIDDKNRLDLFARYKLDDYRGLGAKASSMTVGAEYQRDLAIGATLFAGASWRRTVETGVDPVSAFNIQLGLQKQIDFGKKTAENVSDASASKRR